MSSRRHFVFIFVNYIMYDTSITQYRIGVMKVNFITIRIIIMNERVRARARSNCKNAQNCIIFFRQFKSIPTIQLQYARVKLRSTPEKLKKFSKSQNNLFLHRKHGNI